MPDRLTACRPNSMPSCWAGWRGGSAKTREFGSGPPSGPADRSDHTRRDDLGVNCPPNGASNSGWWGRFVGLRLFSLSLFGGHFGFDRLRYFGSCGGRRVTVGIAFGRLSRRFR